MDSSVAPPKVFQHLCTVFEAMKKESFFVSMTDSGEESGGTVWEGFLTKLFQSLRLPQPYYTSVMKRLKKMGCVQQLSRGGGSAPSRWELIEEPTLELFFATEERKVVGATRFGALEQRIGDLNTRVTQLETHLETLLGRAS